MYRKLVLLIALILLLGMLGLACDIQGVKAGGTIYIRADGSIDPPTPCIQRDGEVYTFADNISDSIVVERNNIVVDGAGYTLQGTGEESGIYLLGRIHVTIRDIKIKEFRFGIYLYRSSNNTVSGSNITDNYCGIRVFESSNNSISGNNVMRNDYGIMLPHSSNNRLYRNHIMANSFYGIRLDKSSNNSISGNSIIANNLYGIGLYVSSTYNAVFGNNITNNNIGISLESSSFNNVSGNNISNNTRYGVHSSPLALSSNNTISGNTISNNEEGVRLYNSSDSTVYGNLIANNYGGVFLRWSSGNKLRNNVVVNSTYNFGVWGEKLLDFVNDVDVSNTVDGKPVYYWINRLNATVPRDAGYVALVNCTNIRTRNLTLTNNWFGIQLAYTRNSIISRNNIANNWYGIWLSNSSDNSIYHNTFADNTHQVYTDVWVNVWDDGYPSGGNYWDDYAGVDLHGGPSQDTNNGDGIGDTLYAIDVNNTDRYPLMGTFSVFNATLEHAVQTVCNSSISDLRFNGTVLSFSVTGEGGTVGFCRIRIPTALMNGTYTVFVNGMEVPHTVLPCSNSTHSYLSFTYNHSTQEVIIIPEFPALIIMPLFMIATLVIIYRRKYSREVTSSEC